MGCIQHRSAGSQSGSLPGALCRQPGLTLRTSPVHDLLFGVGWVGASGRPGGGQTRQPTQPPPGQAPDCGAAEHPAAAPGSDASWMHPRGGSVVYQRGRGPSVLLPAPRRLPQADSARLGNGATHRAPKTVVSASHAPHQPFTKRAVRHGLSDGSLTGPRNCARLRAPLCLLQVDDPRPGVYGPPAFPRDDGVGEDALDVLGVAAVLDV